MIESLTACTALTGTEESVIVKLNFQQMGERSFTEHQYLCPPTRIILWLVHLATCDTV